MGRRAYGADSGERPAPRKARSLTLLARALVAALVISALIPFPALNKAGPAAASPEQEPFPYGLGLLPAPPGDYPQFEIPLIAAASLPSAVDLSGQLPPVGNQENQGSCVAWATGYYYHSWLQKREHTNWNLQDSRYQFSPAFIYNQINGGSDRGSTFPNAFELLMNSGCTDLAQMPYNPNDYTTQPNSLQRNAALQYRINAYANMWRLSRLPSPVPAPIENAKIWLASGKILVMGIPIYTDFPGLSGYNAPYYDYDERSSYLGLHAVAICGYNDNANPRGSDADHRGGFKMANSWGSNWNNGGYVYLSYDFVKRFALEAWTMEDRTPDTPHIDSLSEYCGRPGSTFTISGTNFGAQRRSARVTLNGIIATVASWTNENISVTVPANFSGGPVRVNDWEGNASNPVNFTTQSPSISSLSPGSGSIGTQVTISGSNFGASRGGSYVLFGSAQAAIYESWSDSRIICRVPDLSPGTMQVKVVTRVGSSVGVDFRVTTSDIYEPNDSFDSAYGPLQEGREYQSFIMPGESKDYYYLDLPSGRRTMRVTLTNVPQGCDYDLYCYGADRSQLSYSNRGGDSDEEIVIRSPAAGRYYLEVRAFSGSSAENAYILSYQSEQFSDTYEPNDSFDSAYGPLHFATDYLSYISRQNDEDYFRLSIPEGCASLTVRLEDIPESCDYDLEVFDSGRRSVSVSRWSGNVPEECVVQEPSAGTLFVKVYPYLGYSASEAYRLRAEIIREEDRPPEVESLWPPYGKAGESFVVKGQGFSPRGAAPTVILDSVPCQVTSYSDSRIDCLVPAGSSAGRKRLQVRSGGSISDALDFLVCTSYIYFPYCTDGPGTDSFLCLLNTGGETAPAVLQMTENLGSSIHLNLDLVPQSRTTLMPESLRGGFFCGSLTLAVSGEVMAELPSYQSLSGSLGGDTVIGATQASDRWYFAEGYTGRGFRETIHVQVPGSRDATLTFRFQTEERGEVVVSGLLAEGHGSTTSFSVNDLLGSGCQCSLTVESDLPVVAQRDLDFTYNSRSGERWQGVHTILGAVRLGRDFLFAEGTTRDGFDEWLTIQNPSPQTIEIRAEFQFGQGQGPNLIRDFQVTGGRRLTIFVPDVVGRGKDVSVRLTSSADFLAERPMYFRYRGFGADWDGGHCATGIPAAAQEWLFAEGCTYGGFHEWLCLQNPGDQDSQVEVLYFTQEQGPLAARRVMVPARQRVTLRVNDHAGENLQLSMAVKVISGPAIVAERPLYFTQGNRCGGHTAAGFPRR